ncbi:MAG: citrate synthase [Rickettsiales bacterium]|jgi:citrate synthase
MSNSAKMATLILPDNKKVNLPYKEATIGQNVIDISNLLKEANIFTFDPGFMSTSSCESKITYIDGERGILRHRGYSIEDLAEKSNYLEVSYLLLNGDLPTKEAYKEFSSKIISNSNIEESFYKFYDSLSDNLHPMAILSASTTLITGFYHNSTESLTEEERKEISYKIIAKVPTLAAFAYKKSVGEEFIQPNPELGFVENIIYMFFGKKDQTYKPNPIMADAMNKILILHADHEQNASTSTVRIAGSSGTNPFAAISAGISSLWGPSHGGANEAVINMLEEIGSVKNIPEFIDRAKDKNDPFRLMGFGHRVYKNYDPRAKVLKKSCDEILREFHDEDNQLLQIAIELEKIALNDPYFIKRKLFPNVDFYSGIIYKAMGIPNSFFTVIFAISRVSGWVAQLNESVSDKFFKISRPRQLYTGEVKRNYDNK